MPQIKAIYVVLCSGRLEISNMTSAFALQTKERPGPATEEPCEKDPWESLCLQRKASRFYSAKVWGSRLGIRVTAQPLLARLRVSGADLGELSGSDQRTSRQLLEENTAPWGKVYGLNS